MINGSDVALRGHENKPSSDGASALGTHGPAAKLKDANPSEIPPASGLGGRQNAVTISDILERRAKAGRLIAPTASYSDSDMFKGPVCLFLAQ